MLAPINISNLANKLHKRFIQISTDHYSSINNETRDEKCTFYATNMYGYSKLNSDIQIELANKNALIIRTNFFGYGNNNLFKWVIDKINDNEVIDGYIDIYFNPVSINYLCNAIELLLKSELSGVINVAGDKTVSKHDFITEVADLYADKKIVINKVKAPQDKLSAVRPSDMSLANDKFRKLAKSTIPSLTDMILCEINMIQREINGIFER
jgi:dTDP-4-dehydrorhamnose reductase